MTYFVCTPSRVLPDSSSFFKVSLKTNNKALAGALQAQKERSNQLQVETVCLMKRVDALLFERAIIRFKHKKLLLLLKEIHSNNLLKLNSMAELLSSEDEFGELSGKIMYPDRDSGNVEIKSSLMEKVERFSRMFTQPGDINLMPPPPCPPNSDGGMDQSLTGLLQDERPPWETADTDVSLVDTEMEDNHGATPRRASSGWVTGLKEPPSNTVEDSPVVWLGLNRNDYVGQRLRENAFDPKGKGTSTMLDDLAHCDLALRVALWWLDRDEGQDLLDRDLIGVKCLSGSNKFPNHREREALILSSFAGVVLDALPVEEILALYSSKPAASYSNPPSKNSIVHPFTLSYHPFAMLCSYKAVDHSKKHSQKLKRWLFEKTKGSDEVQENRTKHYEGSLESL
ncbi:hypothetical protein NHX12_007734 [Muraenolepis orangiensis]|uniref:Uncharacterized protein n=1 Tax=Muraenolepis orangiensis TaxID=630683 RepID=A0A9Q0DU18_9TELE|nr:hypothetical protein NHX12_007734 [Muraenolepis orangiensis]